MTIIAREINRQRIKLVISFNRGKFNAKALESFLQYLSFETKKSYWWVGGWVGGLVDGLSENLVKPWA